MNSFIIFLILVVCESFGFSYQSWNAHLRTSSLQALSSPVLGTTKKHRVPELLYFRGGGIYYYWQAGFCEYLQEKSLGLGTPMVGASAGALSAAMLSCDCDFRDATDFVVDQADRYRIYERKSLAFIWGGLIDEWLNHVLPDEIPTRAKNDLHVTLTPMRIWQRPKLVTEFENKHQLKRALMASVHIPFFLNGKLYTKFEGRRYMDGSLYSFVTNSNRIRPLPYELDHTLNDKDIYYVDYNNDKDFLQRNADLNFVSMVSPEGLYSMMDYGYAYAKAEHERGALFPQIEEQNNVMTKI